MSAQTTGNPMATQIQTSAQSLPSGATRPLRLDAPVVALTAVAYALIAFHLGTKGLNTDELVSGVYARMSFASLWHVITHTDPNMGLYYVALHLWAQIFGSGPVALRSMSMLVSGMAVPLIVALGTRLFNRPTGLLAGFLLALNPFFVQYAQDARSYGLLVTLSIGSTLLFIRAREDATPRRLVAYTAVSALAVYAHYFSLLVLLVHAGVLLAVDRQAALSRRWISTAAALAVISAPDLAIAAGRSVNVAWVPKPTLSDVLHLPSTMFGGPAAVVLAALGVYVLGLNRRGEGRRSTVALAAWAVVPVLLVFIESRVTATSLFEARYLIIVVPPVTLLGAAGIARLGSNHSHLLAAVVTAIVAAALSLPLHRWYSSSSQNSYRSVTRYVSDHFKRGDMFSFGALRSVAQAEGIFGQSYWGVDYYWVSDRRGPLHFVAASALSGISTRRLPKRVWLVLDASVNSLEQLPAKLRADLAHNYSPVNLKVSLNSFPTAVLYTLKRGR